MVRAIAFALPQRREPFPLEMLRSLIVCGCAVVLIAAGQALPF